MLYDHYQRCHSSKIQPLQKLSYIRDERLDTLDTFKEQHEALLEALQDNLVLATADFLSRHALQAFHEFRGNVNYMDVLEKLKQLQRKIQEKK